MLTNADMVAAAELQHEEDVKAAEGQHEKMKHAKASASNPEPEAQGQGEGEAVATKVVNGGDGHNPDSTPASFQSPQVLLLVFLLFILVGLSSLVAVFVQARPRTEGHLGGLYMPDLGERPVSDD